MKTRSTPFIVTARTITAVVLLALLGVGVAACDIINGKAPPSPIESALYQTITNYIDVPVLKTNVVNVTNHVVEYSTNEIGQIVQRTNDVIIPKYELVTVTNQIPSYDFQLKDSVKEKVQADGGFLNTVFPGWGTGAAYGVLALLGAWGHVRGSKNGRTSEALSQEVETMLEFLKALPNGASYKSAITAWLQSHQVQAGVADKVLSLLDDQVDNPAAKEAAEEIRNVLGAARIVGQNASAPTPPVAQP